MCESKTGSKGKKRRKMSKEHETKGTNHLPAVYQTFEEVHYFVIYNAIFHYNKKPIALTEVTNVKQMHGPNKSDIEKMPMKRCWQGKEDFRAEHIQATLLSSFLGCSSKEHHTCSNSEHCCSETAF